MIEHSMSRSAQTMQLVKLLRQLEVEKAFFTGSDFLTYCRVLMHAVRNWPGEKSCSM